MRDGSFQSTGDLPDAVIGTMTWEDLGGLIRQLASELADEIARNPDAVTAALLLIGGPGPVIDVSRN
ncbi:MAG: hypothetical protein JSV19_10545 [Phycisphaerales bacterium]|nr:MAG: hypothetical protein JSV19_10545 [Phycisphaerales bacterium]